MVQGTGDGIDVDMVNMVKDDKIDSNKRSFLRKLWIVLGFVALAECIAVGLAFLRPGKPVTKTGDYGNIFEVGAVDDFEKSSVTAFVRGQFYLARLDDGGFLAVSRKCTHLGCTVPWDSEKKKFVCPCHSSAFDITGEVISPPAPRALDIYLVTIENGIVSVNTGKKTKRRAFEVSQVVYHT